MIATSPLRDKVTNFWADSLYHCDHEMEIGRSRSKSIDVLKTLAHSTAQSSYEEENHDKALKV